MGLELAQEVRELEGGSNSGVRSKDPNRTVINFDGSEEDGPTISIDNLFSDADRKGFTINEGEELLDILPAKSNEQGVVLTGEEIDKWHLELVNQNVEAGLLKLLEAREEDVAIIFLPQNETMEVHIFRYVGGTTEIQGQRIGRRVIVPKSKKQNPTKRAFYDILLEKFFQKRNQRDLAILGHQVRESIRYATTRPTVPSTPAV